MYINVLILNQKSMGVLETSIGQVPLNGLARFLPGGRGGGGRLCTSLPGMCEYGVLKQTHIEGVE